MSIRSVSHPLLSTSAPIVAWFIVQIWTTSNTGCWHSTTTRMAMGAKSRCPESHPMGRRQLDQEKEEAIQAGSTAQNAPQCMKQRTERSTGYASHRLERLQVLSSLF